MKKLLSQLLVVVFLLTKYVLQISVGGDDVKEPEIQQIDFELVN